MNHYHCIHLCVTFVKLNHKFSCISKTNYFELIAHDTLLVLYQSFSV